MLARSSLELVIVIVSHNFSHCQVRGGVGGAGADPGEGDQEGGGDVPVWGRQWSGAD